MQDPWFPPFDARRAHCGPKSPQSALPVDGSHGVSDCDASCIRARLIGGPTLKECVAGVYTLLTYQWFNVSTLSDNMLNVCRWT